MNAARRRSPWSRKTGFCVVAVHRNLACDSLNSGEFRSNYRQLLNAHIDDDILTISDAIASHAFPFPLFGEIGAIQTTLSTAKAYLVKLINLCLLLWRDENAIIRFAWLCQAIEWSEKVSQTWSAQAINMWYAATADSIGDHRHWFMTLQPISRRDYFCLYETFL